MSLTMALLHDAVVDWRVGEVFALVVASAPVFGGVFGEPKADADGKDGEEHCEGRHGCVCVLAASGVTVVEQGTLG